MFHYTNLRSIEGILSNKQFWASKINCLNDIDEQWYCFELFYREVFRTIDFTRAKNQKLREVIELDIVDKHRLMEIPKFSNIFMNTYIISLTENSDSLYLWSSYSDGFYGYNLGLDVQELIQSCASFEPDIRFVFGKVFYNKDEQIKLLRDTINYILDICENIEQGDSAYNMFANMFLYYSIFFKKECFKFEEEYRLAYILSKDINNSHTIKFRFNQMPIPYLEVNLKPETFKSICVGPKNSSPIINMGINEFRKTLGLENMAIYNSSIKIR